MTLFTGTAVALVVDDWFCNAYASGQDLEKEDKTDNGWLIESHRLRKWDVQNPISGTNKHPDCGTKILFSLPTNITFAQARKNHVENVMAILQAILIGMAIAMVGTIPRNLLYFANMQYFTAVPWAVPLVAVYMWLFWRHLNGYGPPQETSAQRRTLMRANPLSGRVWFWSLLAGTLGIVALVTGLRFVNRMVTLPEQALPDITQVPRYTMLALLLMAAPVAGIIEEVAFRGYMQKPIEEKYGLFVAILITGTMFGVAHLDFTLVLWPYYVLVAAIYGTVTYLTNSILPAVVLHTGGNIFSNFDLWLHGRAEWQTGSGPSTLIWQSGTDSSFVMTGLFLLAMIIITVLAYLRLARVTGLDRKTAAPELTARQDGLQKT
jgi:membrane protease YdiL (CAAX protease family)